MIISDGNKIDSHQNANSSLIEPINPYWPKAQVLKSLTTNTPTVRAIAPKKKRLNVNELPAGSSFRRRFMKWGSTIKGKLIYIGHVKKQVT